MGRRGYGRIKISIERLAMKSQVLKTNATKGSEKDTNNLLLVKE